MLALRPLFVRTSLGLALLGGGAALYALKRPATPTVVVATATTEADEDEGMPQDFVCSAGIDDEVDEEASDDDASDHEALAVLEITASQPGCVYYSAWDSGPVELDAAAQEIDLEQSFDFEDGCRWFSHEHLEALGLGRYRYTYTEKAVSCPPRHVPASACTRSGVVTVE